ncbi:uncharacterized protein BJ171DRAFT_493284 [Polychytrium aggregatum]|uniref:uncharacterized protein n=1 Tax=Polychytrium aggregatum TaxID=110093 RepID=UPI0022FE9BDA|nr:uncharacterized protein BJ171DRAFT_493284 [Polychytrium aggregatum]KAI9207635.1 hypothetical protein BJ171DRAFT_493284 [Polychytrium aggregatum]
MAPQQDDAVEGSLEARYFCVGSVEDFAIPEGKTASCTPVPLADDPKRRVNLIHKIDTTAKDGPKTKFHAVLNICPHQGAPLHKGVVTDIEDMGIIWGTAITCHLHGWTYDVTTGTCENSRTILDCFDVKVVDARVWVSRQPSNLDVKGPRRDFGGNELDA